MERMRKEETNAFREMGNRTEKMESIVADARNIHKSLRDTLAAAAMYYKQAADCTAAIDLASSALERENAGQRGT